MKLLRFQSWLASVWAGMLIATGGIAAPSLFLVLDRVSAGRGAGQIFTIEAKVSLGLAMLLLMLERRRLRDLSESGHALSAMSGNLLLILAALFLAILGEFVLHPMIEAAKQGQVSGLSFGALHGISASLYWLRTVLVATLAWRTTGLRSEA
jgi:uncharacterized membrane protein YhaH (DUF805 family)